MNIWSIFTASERAIPHQGFVLSQLHKIVRRMLRICAKDSARQTHRTVCNCQFETLERRALLAAVLDVPQVAYSVEPMAAASFVATETASTRIYLSASIDYDADPHRVAFEAHVFDARDGMMINEGVVDFTDVETGAVLGTGPVRGQIAVLGVDVPATGARQFQASYRGTDRFGASASFPMSLSVGKAWVNVNLNAPAIAAIGYPQAVHIGANSSAPLHGGTATIFEGATPLATLQLNDGNGTWTTDGLSEGTHELKVIYAEDATHFGAESNPIDILVKPQPVATTLELNAPISVVSGDDLTIVAHVIAADGSPVNSGWVEIKLGDQWLRTGTPQDGVVTLVGSWLGPVELAFTASYRSEPELDFAPSASSAVVKVTQIPVNVVVTPSLQQVTYGNESFNSALSVAVIADTEPIDQLGSFEVIDADSGDIVFYAGRDQIGLGSLPPGDYHLRARYVAPQNRYIGTSDDFEVVVRPATPLIKPTLLNQGEELQIAIDPPEGYPSWATKPSGVALVLEGDAVIGSVQLDSGVGTFNLPDFGIGQRLLQVRYQGDNLFAPANGDILISRRGPQQIALDAQHSRIMSGASASLSARITTADMSGEKLIGMVAFFDQRTNDEAIFLDHGNQVRGVILGTAMIDDDGVASLEVAGLPAGPHQIRAIYLGRKSVLMKWDPWHGLVDALTHPTSEFESAASSVLTVAVVQPTSLNLQRWFAATPSHSPTFTATVGNSAGQSYRTMDLPKDDGFSNSNSASVSIHVPRRTPAVPPSLAPWGGGPYGVIVTCFCHFGPPLPPAPTGKVTFMEGSKVLGKATVDSTGTATFKPGKLAIGQHEIVAIYAGDDRYDASTSQVLQYTVTKTQTATKLTGSRNVLRQGGNVILTASVSTDHDQIWPMGWVVLKDGNKRLGAFKLGKPTKEIDLDLSVGTHLITAEYRGDKNCFSSDSVAFKLRVKPA